MRQLRRVVRIFECGGFAVLNVESFIRIDRYFVIQLSVMSEVHRNVFVLTLATYIYIYYCLQIYLHRLLFHVS